MHRCIDNCRYLKTSFLSPNKSRTELTPKFLDRSTPNSVLRRYHNLGIMEIHRNSYKNTQKKHSRTTNTHLHLRMSITSMKIDLGWWFWDPRPVLWMPDGSYKSPDATIHVQNLGKCPKRHAFRHGWNVVSLVPWPWNPEYIKIYIYILIYL